MANIVTPRTLSGFMELAPKDQMVFEKIKQTLETTYRSFGFYPIDTPILESSEVLLAKGGGETEKQIYRFQKGDTDLSMRFDLTVPLAKYVAKNYSELTFPFKRYQIGKVYRGERAQKGRFREFYQADIDIIGDESISIMNDAEVPSIMYKVFTSLGLVDFTIRLNNRKVLGGIFELMGFSNDATDIMRVIDKLDKIGEENVKKELADIGVSAESADMLLSLLSFTGSNEEIIAKLKEYEGKSEKLDLGISELSDVVYYMEKFGVAKEAFKIDLTIARGLDYYTGTVYETTFNRHPEIGSICSGGRYDDLAGYYTNKKLPGVGMSIGLTRLFYILCEKEYLNKNISAPVDVLVIPMTEDFTKAVEISNVLRDAKINTQIYFEKKKFKHKIGYADKLSIPYVIFLGEDEIAENKVKVKDMVTGEQSLISLEEAVSLIEKGKLNNANDKCIILD